MNISIYISGYGFTNGPKGLLVNFIKYLAFVYGSSTTPKSSMREVTRCRVSKFNRFSKFANNLAFHFRKVSKKTPSPRTLCARKFQFAKCYARVTQTLIKIFL